MAKRLFSCLLAFSLVFALCACGAPQQSTAPVEPTEAVTESAVATPEVVEESEPTYEVTYSSCKAVPSDSADAMFACAYVQTIFAVKNTSDVAISFTDGYYDITDQNGTAVESPSTYNLPLYVAPSETAYIGFINPTNNQAYLTAESLTATPTFYIDKAFFTPVQLDVGNYEYLFEPDGVYNNYGTGMPQPGRGFVVIGDINNATSERVSNASISVTFFNNDTPIGVISSFSDAVPANSSASFEVSDSFLGKFITSDEITSTEISVTAMP